MNLEDINGVQAGDGYYVVSIIEAKANNENGNNEGIQKRRYPEKKNIWHILRTTRRLWLFNL